MKLRDRDPTPCKHETAASGFVVNLSRRMYLAKDSGVAQSFPKHVYFANKISLCACYLRANDGQTWV